MLWPTPSMAIPDDAANRCQNFSTSSDADNLDLQTELGPANVATVVSAKPLYGSLRNSDPRWKPTI